MPKQRPFAGKFSFETFVTSLLQTDIGETKDVLDLDEYRHLKYVHLISLRHAVTYERSTIPIDLIRFDIFPRPIQEILFHERTHFWQFIASPPLQFWFLTMLDDLQTAVRKYGGRDRYICAGGISADDPEWLERWKHGACLGFRWADVTPDIMVYGEGCSKSPDLFLHLHLPYGQSGFGVPTYGTAFRQPGDVPVKLALTGLALLESAAYTSEQLFRGESPKPLPRKPDKNSLLYSGAWEFWRRLQKKNYDTKADLALSFLAAVDLALTGDISASPGSSTLPNPYGACESTVVSYRFGRLACRIDDVEPLRCPDGDAAGAVARFQERICTVAGWPPPAWGVQIMAVILTEYLVHSNNLIPAFQNLANAADVLDIIRRFFSLPRLVDENARNVQELELVWSAINEVVSTCIGHKIGFYKIGFYIVVAMLNACIYRLRHPGDFAVPHFSYQRLAPKFPLPFILYKNQYLGELPIFTEDDKDNVPPIKITSYHVANDCLNLMTLLPLINGEQRCGMIEQISPEILRPQCMYARIFGCPHPLVGLNEEQQHMRKKMKLYDFCHWKQMSVNLNLVNPEEARRWRARWRRWRALRQQAEPESDDTSDS